VSEYPGQEPGQSHKFDELARGLASGSLSRRRALKLFVATALATLVPARFAGADDDRDCKRRGERCGDGRGQCCGNLRCRDGRCRRSDEPPSPPPPSPPPPSPPPPSPPPPPPPVV
jgi:hypothetical protein